MPSGSSQVTMKLLLKEDGKEIMDEGHAVFAKCGSGGVAMSNHIIIAEISSYLDDRELESWYEAFRNFTHITDQMAQVCWRKQALKLANILEDKYTWSIWNNLEEKWPEKTSREIFHILLDEMRAKCNCASQMKMSKEQFLAAASLAHQGLLGPIDKLCLEDLYNISIPREHLQAIVSSATEEVLIRNQYLSMQGNGALLPALLPNPSLKIILDSVKSKVLAIRETDLNPENTEALVRAMDTRVVEVKLGWLEKIWLPEEEPPKLVDPETCDIEALMEYGDGACKSLVFREGPVTFDIEALMRYNGDGACKSLVFRGNTSAGPPGEYIRMWADSRIYWEICDNYDELSLKRNFQMSFKT